MIFPWQLPNAVNKWQILIWQTDIEADTILLELRICNYFTSMKWNVSPKHHNQPCTYLMALFVPPWFQTLASGGNDCRMTFSSTTQIALKSKMAARNKVRNLHPTTATSLTATSSLPPSLPHHRRPPAVRQSEGWAVCECHSTSLALCWPLVCAGKAVGRPLTLSNCPSTPPHLTPCPPPLLHHAYLPLHYAFSHINRLFSFFSRPTLFHYRPLPLLPKTLSIPHSISLSSPLSFSPLLVLFTCVSFFLPLSLYSHN